MSSMWTLSTINVQVEFQVVELVFLLLCICGSFLCELIFFHSHMHPIANGRTTMWLVLTMMDEVEKNEGRVGEVDSI